MVIGIIWPALYWPRALVKDRKELWLCWAAACTGSAIFPLLPVDKQEDLAAM